MLSYDEDPSSCARESGPFFEIKIESAEKRECSFLGIDPDPGFDSVIIIDPIDLWNPRREEETTGKGGRDCAEEFTEESRRGEGHRER